MECSICIETKSRALTCPRCATVACDSCQTQYGIPACANCSAAFTLGFLKATAPKLVTSVFKPHHEKTFWDREKALLPNTQALVDWEVKTEELKKQLRFGLRPAFPQKPHVSLSSMLEAVFPCPSSECRGFVQGKRCGSCKLEVCMRCREQMKEDHVCNEHTVASIAALAADTKPCPKCTALIFKTQGCDHMFCTHCRTHFDWKTGKITAQSTNHHYDNTTAFAQNVATRIRDSAASQASDSCGPPDVSIDAVRSTDVPREVRETLLYRLLYLESAQARQMRNSLFDPRKVMDMHDAALIQTRLNYLRGKLDEAKAKSRVYQLEMQMQKKVDSERLLGLFLATVNDLQRMWRERGFPRTDAEIEGIFFQLLSICDSSSIGIQSEYGGQRILFRTHMTNDNLPVVTLTTGE